MLLGNAIPIPFTRNRSGAPVDVDSLILEVNTSLSGQTSSNQFKIQIQTFGGFTYNYDVDWGDGNEDTGVSSDITHSYATPGIYDVKISGQFPGTKYSFGDAQKIINIKQWGTIEYKRLRESFRGARNLGDITATDAPNLNNLDAQGISSLFKQCFSMTNTNGSLTTWDTSNVASMNACFQQCHLFNQPIPQNWDFSSVTGNGLSYLFFECYALDQDVGQINADWNNITAVTAPFGKAGKNTTPKYNICNYDVSTWDMSNVVFMSGWSSGQSASDSSLSDKQPLSIGMDQWDLSGLGTYGSVGYGEASIQGLFGDMKENTSGVGCSWSDIVSGWASYMNPTNVDKINYNSLFYASTFNEDLSSWDFSNGVQFSSMFQRNNYYNQSISGWNLNSLASQSLKPFQAYQQMFRDADNFDQPLGDLNIGAPPTTAWGQMFDALLRNESISTANYDSTLVAWNNQINALPAAERPTGCPVNMGSSTYTIGSAADTARANLITTYSWSFIDGGGI